MNQCRCQTIEETDGTGTRSKGNQEPWGTHAYGIKREKEAEGNLHHEDAHLLLLALDLPDDAE